MSKYIINSYLRKTYNTDEKIKEFLNKNADDFDTEIVTPKSELYDRYTIGHPNCVISYPDEFDTIKSLKEDIKLKKYSYFRDGWGCIYENVVCYESI